MLKTPTVIISVIVSVAFISCKGDKDGGNGYGFSKSATVFGIKILATKATGDAKILHAAKVMAQYLDNDEDGKVDNQAVVDQLKSVNATLVMFKDEDEADNFHYDGPDLNHAQGLWDEETIPSFNKNSSNSRFDASLEEVLHLITHEGYSEVYPELAEKKGSKLASAMDKARGGYFESPPANYPAGAWYSYDDKTCEYDCMITEYFYWALTSLMGGQSYPGRLNEIGHEWKLNTPEKLKTGDPDVYGILTDPQYGLPSILPDGEYNGYIISLDQ